MQINALLQQAIILFEKVSLNTAKLDAELLLGYVLQKPRSYLLAYPELEISAIQAQKFLDLIQQRSQKIPLAYLIGEKEFWSLNFKMTSDVLVPRPETELLVEIILRDYADCDELTLIDLGTGSGAIAIALAAEKPQWKIFASDQSLQALKVAEQNAIMLLKAEILRCAQDDIPGHCAQDDMPGHSESVCYSKLAGHSEPDCRSKHACHSERSEESPFFCCVKNITFLHSDWLQQFPKNLCADVIVSNPPYLAENDPHLLNSEISHEPRNALVAPDNGLADYEKISQQARAHLNPNGRIYFEHGAEQAKAIQGILQQNGFTKVKTYDDLAGLPRVTMGDSSLRSE